jgi:protein gp37
VGVVGGEEGAGPVEGVEVMGETSIEWTRGDDGTPGRTWNLFRGCRRKSTGCEHCFAEGIAARFSGPGMPFEGIAEMTEHGPRWTGKGAFVMEKLADPLRWKNGCRIFVNSMSDLWYEEFSDQRIAAAFGVMAACPRHTFQILTKRTERLPKWFKWLTSGSGRFAPASPRARILSHAGGVFEDELGNDRMAKLFQDLCWDEQPGDGDFRRPPPGKGAWPLPNVWIGTSIENRATLGRLDHLRKVPAAVRFVSFEPLLEDLGSIDLAGIAWVIVGSESGRGARPMNEDWIRSLRDQCQAQGVPFFFKQRLDGKGHKVSLPVLDGRQWAEFPEART